MGDNKKREAAKAFVDSCSQPVPAVAAVPVKKWQPTSPCNRVMDRHGLVPPPNSAQLELSSNQESAAADCRHSDSKHGKSKRSIDLWKGSSSVIVCPVDSDPSLMSFGVNYGARDYYCPYPAPATGNPGSYYTTSKEDMKVVYDDYTGNEFHEWWQGSYNY